MINRDSIIKFTNSLKLLYIVNEDLQELSTCHLEDVSLELIVADNDEDLLDKFYDNDVDIIIADISLSNATTLEILESIRSFDKDISIIVISDHNESEYFTKLIQLNIDAYLLKPIKKDDLEKSFKKIMEKINFYKKYNNNVAFLEQYQELTDVYAAVSKTDIKGVITYVNEKFCQSSGYSKKELVGKNHNIVRHPDNAASSYSDLWHTIKYEKETWQGVLRNKSKNKTTYYVNSIIKPILDMNNQIVEYISMNHDITDIISPKKQLYDFIDSAINPMVVLISIDSFIDIEKLYGHTLAQVIEDRFGNDLLSNMPEYLKFSSFFPLGNGEYIFAQDLSMQDLTDINSIIEELRNFQFIINELKIDVGDIDYDIGTIMSISNGEHCLENVKYGIDFLIQSKQDFILAKDFAQKEQDDALHNLKVLKMVKTAIDTSNIISYFQPIVCNKTQEIVKYESLVRLVDEEENIILPFFFLDIAKKGKYYSRITNMVLENSFNALHQTQKSIAVNISALDIEKLSTRNKIYELLEKYKENAARLVFELLEDEDVRDFDEIEKFISKVKGYGVKIAIDDFGAGYSNFERLLKYQPDILKIDGSLVKNIETDSYSMSVVKSIVAFAKEQKIEMVAEYIENENIFNILKNLGVEYSQGYYFGKPDLMVII